MSDGHAGRAKPSRYAFSTRAIHFGPAATLRGRLYTPDRPTTPAVVVLAPGAGLPWRPTLEATAERLAERGYAAFAFDHRGFGRSGEGLLIDPERQRADLDAAIETVRDAPAVDGDRLAVWGMDLSAGTALAAAAESPAVDVVIARFPVAAGAALLPDRLRSRLRGLAAGLVDYPLSALGRLRDVPPDERGRRVPLFGAEDEAAAVAAAGTSRSVRETLERDPGTTPARSLIRLQRHDPSECFEDVRCPVLCVAGERDRLAPPDSVRALSEAMAKASLVTVPTDHYGPLGDVERSRTVGHELAFLDAEL